jgi:hypothetical protein
MQYHCKFQNYRHICMFYKLVTCCLQSWGDVGVICKDVHPVERIVFWVMAEHTERPAALGITEKSSCCRYTLFQALLYVNYMHCLRQHKSASWADCVGRVVYPGCSICSFGQWVVQGTFRAKDMFVNRTNIHFIKVRSNVSWRLGCVSGLWNLPCTYHICGSSVSEFQG